MLLCSVCSSSVASLCVYVCVWVWVYVRMCVCVCMCVCTFIISCTFASFIRIHTTVCDCHLVHAIWLLFCICLLLIAVLYEQRSVFTYVCTCMCNSSLTVLSVFSQLLLRRRKTGRRGVVLL